MPTQSQRQHLLKKISGRINKLDKIGFSKGMRRYQAFLELHRIDILGERYLSRPKQYRPVRHAPTIRELLDSHPRAFRFLFRLTHTESFRLITRLHEYPSLAQQQGPGRPPAKPEEQVALYLYRLAHSHEVKAISRLFGISDGTVVKWSDNACEAIQSLWNEVVYWPKHPERQKIKGRLLALYGIPDCLGFIDGIHIPLYQAPQRPDKSAATYFSRKGDYALNVLAIVDHKKRFRLVQYGHTGATNDCTAQKDLPFEKGGEDMELEYFDNKEHIVGDSGFTCTSRILAMCKRGKGRRHLFGYNAYYNYKAAPARVTVEHAFGIFKARWNSLTDLRLTLHEQTDERRAYGWIKCGVILHNLFVNTWQDVLSREEVAKLVREARKKEARDTGSQDDPRAHTPRQSHKRRMEVAEQMLRMEEEDSRPDMDTFML